jgi:ankyrin repeat protein
MSSELTASEREELERLFRAYHLINYEDDDPCAPIDPLTYVAPDGDTSLHIASHRGDLRAVELLVQAGLGLNQQGDMGYTPLHYASTPEIVEFLLSKGARTDIFNEFGGAPIGWNDR